MTISTPTGYLMLGTSEVVTTGLVCRFMFSWAASAALDVELITGKA